MTRPARRAAGAARTAAWLVGTYVAVEIVGVWLAKTALLAAVAQMTIGEWGTSRVRLRREPTTLQRRGTLERTASTTPDAQTTPRDAYRASTRTMRGALAALPAILVLVVSLVRRGPPRFELAVLPVALLGSIAAAVRDELILHGAFLPLIPLGVGRGRRNARAALACAASSMCATWGRSGSLSEIATAAAVGALTGSLWQETESALAPCAAHAGWLFAAAIA